MDMTVDELLSRNPMPLGCSHSIHSYLNNVEHVSMRQYENGGKVREIGHRMVTDDLPQWLRGRSQTTSAIIVGTQFSFPFHTIPRRNDPKERHPLQVGLSTPIFNFRPPKSAHQNTQAEAAADVAAPRSESPSSRGTARL